MLRYTEEDRTGQMGMRPFSQIDFKCHLTPLAFWTGKLSINRKATSVDSSFSFFFSTSWETTTNIADDNVIIENTLRARTQLSCCTQYAPYMYNIYCQPSQPPSVSKSWCSSSRWWLNKNEKDKQISYRRRHHVMVIMRRCASCCLLPAHSPDGERNE